MQLPLLAPDITLVANVWPPPQWLGVELVVVAILVLVVPVAAWWTARYFRRRSQVDKSGVSSARASASVPGSAQAPAEVPSRPAMDSGLLRLSETDEDVPPQEAFLASSDPSASKSCPRCERKFPGYFEICPFDSSVLNRISGSSTSSKKDQRVLDRCYCPECHRRYGLAARYCYHDGHRIHRDTDRLADGAPTISVCRQCGWESLPDDSVSPPGQCPRDGQPLETIDPGDRRQIPPVFPFNRCRQCGHIAAPDEVLCPVDDSLLLPEWNARLISLPPTGFGTRRKVCPECGSQFGDHCSHCSYDGTALVQLN